MPGDNSSKTEKPTPQRLKKAREQGQFLSAREFVSALQFVALLVILTNWLPRWEAQIQLSTRTLFQRAFGGDIGPEEWPVLLRTLFSDTLIPIAEAGGLLLLILRAHKKAGPKWLPNPISRSGQEIAGAFELLANSGFGETRIEGKVGSSPVLTARKKA